MQNNLTVRGSTDAPVVEMLELADQAMAGGGAAAGRDLYSLDHTVDAPDDGVLHQVVDSHIALRVELLVGTTVERPAS